REGPVAVAVPAVDAAEVVERDLGGRRRGELLGGLPAAVPQQAVAEAAAGHGPELLLHLLDRRAAGRVPRVQPDGVDRGEPAGGAGDVDAGHDVLAAVALQVDEHAGAAASPAPPPLRHGEGQAGEEDVVGA